MGVSELVEQRQERLLTLASSAIAKHHEMYGPVWEDKTRPAVVRTDGDGCLIESAVRVPEKVDKSEEVVDRGCVLGKQIIRSREHPPVLPECQAYGFECFVR